MSLDVVAHVHPASVLGRVDPLFEELVQVYHRGSPLAGWCVVEVADHTSAMDSWHGAKCEADSLRT
jgi:hypothetical protein